MSYGMRVTIGQAVDALAWSVGDLSEEEFDQVWKALGVVVRAVTRKEQSSIEARSAMHEIIADAHETTVESA